MDNEERKKSFIFGSEGWGWGVTHRVLFPLMQSEFPARKFIMDRNDDASRNYADDDHDFIVASFFPGRDPLWNKVPKKYFFYSAEPYNHDNINEDPTKVKQRMCCSEFFVISSRTDVSHNIHIPYFLYMPYRYMPRLSPNKDRPYFLGFCASNDTNNRNHMYNLLVEKCGGKTCHAMGKLCGNHPETKTDNKGLPQSWEETFPEIYKNYTFALVFENSQFDGYVTEKLLAALVSGAIPIYFGAKNVGDYFNKKTFIDVNDFPSYESCADYVVSLTQTQIDTMTSTPYMNETSEVANLFNDEYNSTHHNKVLAEYKRKLKTFVIS